MHLVTLAGCTEPDARPQQVLDWLADWLGHYGLPVRAIRPGRLPAEDLLHARREAPAIRAAVQVLAGAQALLIATPVRLGTYTGVLKTFLDLLPAGALAGVRVLPLACGGEASRQLTLHYALKPVLDALGASGVLSSLQIGARQARMHDDGLLVLDPGVETRIEAALLRLLAGLPLAASLPTDALPPPPRALRRLPSAGRPAG